MILSKMSTNWKDFLQNLWNSENSPCYLLPLLKSPFPQQQICKEEKEGRAAYALSAFVEFKEIALCCLLAAA